MHTVLVRFPRNRKKSPRMRDREERLAALERRRGKMLSDLRVLEARYRLLPREKRTGDEGRDLERSIAESKTAIRSVSGKITRLSRSFVNLAQPLSRMRAARIR